MIGYAVDIGVLTVLVDDVSGGVIFWIFSVYYYVFLVTYFPGLDK